MRMNFSFRQEHIVTRCNESAGQSLIFVSTYLIPQVRDAANARPFAGAEQDDGPGEPPLYDRRAMAERGRDTRAAACLH